MEKSNDLFALNGTGPEEWSKPELKIINIGEFTLGCSNPGNDHSALSGTGCSTA